MGFLPRICEVRKILLCLDFTASQQGAAAGGISGHLLAGHKKSQVLGHCSHALGHQGHFGEGLVCPSDAGSQEATRELGLSQRIRDSLTCHGEVGKV